MNTNDFFTTVPLLINYNEELEGKTQYNIEKTTGDIYENSNVLLLPFNETHNSTSIKDLVKTNRTFSALTGANHTTAEKPFGRSSLYCSTTATTETTDTTDNIKIWWQKPYSIDAWIKPITLTSYYWNSVNVPNIVGCMYTAGTNYWSWGIDVDGCITLYYYNQNNGNIIKSSTNIVKTNVWQHIAMQQDSGTVHFYYNGKKVHSQNYVPTPQAGISTITFFKFTNSYNGYIKNLRITYSGPPRFTRNFEPEKTLLVRGKPSYIPDITNYIKVWRYTKPIYLVNKTVKAGSAFEYPSKGIENSTLKTLSIETETLNKYPYNNLKTISVLPSSPRAVYNIANKRMSPFFTSNAMPTNWIQTAHEGIYVGGTTNAQTFPLNNTVYTSSSNAFTFVCRLKPTTTESVSKTLSCTGADTAAAYQMLIAASHGSSNGGIGITMGTNQSHLVIHKDATYTPIAKITGLDIKGWVWVVVSADTSNFVTYKIYDDKGKIIGSTTTACTSTLNSPANIGSQYVHGQGYVSDTMIFNTVIPTGDNLFLTINPQELYRVP